MPLVDLVGRQSDLVSVPTENYCGVYWTLSPYSDTKKLKKHPLLDLHSPPSYFFSFKSSSFWKPQIRSPYIKEFKPQYFKASSHSKAQIIIPHIEKLIPLFSLHTLRDGVGVHKHPKSSTLMFFLIVLYSFLHISIPFLIFILRLAK